MSRSTLPEAEGALQPDLMFVAACCRWPDDDARRERVRAMAASVGDWDKVAGLAAGHRVEAFVAQAMDVSGIEPPASVAAGLRAAAEVIRSSALLHIAETLRIADRLDRDGIEHRFLKGIPLGVAVYGTPVLKWSFDIDLVVKAGDAVAAAEALVSLGFWPSAPARPFDQVEFERWSAVSKDAEFRNEAGTTVELHWAITYFPMMVKEVDPFRGCRMVSLLGDRSVATIDDAQCLIYLAAHGASHGWSRLKWLADFAALLTSYPPHERAMLCEQAAKLGLPHALEQGLLLVDRLLGDGIVAPELIRDPSPRARRLEQLALVAIARRRPDAEIESDDAARRAIFRSRWLLGKGLGFMLRHAIRRIRGSEERKQVALPRGLHWLYWLLRPAMWLGRRLKRGW